MNPVQTSLYQVGIVGVQIALFVGAVFSIVVAGPTSLDYIVSIAVIPLIFVGAIMWLTFVYKIWNSIPESFDGPSPTAAVIGLLIPVFNLYWIFRVFVGFARTVETYIMVEDSGELQKDDISSHLFMAAVIFQLLPIPVVQWLSAWKLIGQAGDAANTLRDTRGDEIPLSRISKIGGAVITVLLSAVLFHQMWTNIAVPDFPDIDDPCECDVMVSDEAFMTSSHPGFFHDEEDERAQQRATEAARTLGELYDIEMHPTWNIPAVLWLEATMRYRELESSDNRAIRYTSQPRTSVERHWASPPTAETFTLMEINDFLLLFHGDDRGRSNHYYLVSDLSMEEILERIDADEMSEYEGESKHGGL